MPISQREAEQQLNARFLSADVMLVQDLAARVALGRSTIDQACTTLREMGFEDKGPQAGGSAVSSSTTAAAVAAAASRPAASFVNAPPPRVSLHSTAGAAPTASAPAPPTRRPAPVAPMPTSSAPSRFATDAPPVDVEVVIGGGGPTTTRAPTSRPTTSSTAGVRNTSATGPTARASSAAPSQRAWAMDGGGEARRNNDTAGAVPPPGRRELSGAPASAVGDWTISAQRNLPITETADDRVRQWRTDAPPAAAPATSSTSAAATAAKAAGEKAAPSPSSPLVGDNSGARASSSSRDGGAAPPVAAVGGAASLLPARHMAMSPHGGSSGSSAAASPASNRSATAGGASSSGLRAGPSQAVVLGPEEAPPVLPHEAILYMSSICFDGQEKARTRRFELLLLLCKIPYHAFDLSENGFMRRKIIELNGGVNPGFPVLFIGERCFANYPDAQEYADSFQLFSKLKAAGYRSEKLDEQVAAEAIKRAKYQKELAEFNRTLFATPGSSGGVNNTAAAQQIDEGSAADRHQDPSSPSPASPHYGQQQGARLFSAPHSSGGMSATNGFASFASAGGGDQGEDVDGSPDRAVARGSSSLCRATGSGALANRPTGSSPDAYSPSRGPGGGGAAAVAAGSASPSSHGGSTTRPRLQQQQPSLMSPLPPGGGGGGGGPIAGGGSGSRDRAATYDASSPKLQPSSQTRTSAPLLSPAFLERTPAATAGTQQQHSTARSERLAQWHAML